LARGERRSCLAARQPNGRALALCVCVHTEFQALTQKAGLRCVDKCIAYFLPQLHSAREIIRGESVGSTILFPKNIKHSPQIAYKCGHHFDFKRFIMLLQVGLFMVCIIIITQ
jgi:hypothetical protein